MTSGRGEDVGDLAARHGFSESAARALLDAMQSSHGAMAQFSHPELGGMGQWSRGGMLMIGDMFNNDLKARVGALAGELARSFGTEADPREPESGLPPMHVEKAARWWPEELGEPASAGAQNGIRYAVFPDEKRLAVERDGRLSVRDTGDISISGVSQSQGASFSLRLSGDRGTVDLADLPEV